MAQKPQFPQAFAVLTGIIWCFHVVCPDRSPIQWMGNDFLVPADYSAKLADRRQLEKAGSRGCGKGHILSACGKAAMH